MPEQGTKPKPPPRCPRCGERVVDRLRTQMDGTLIVVERCANPECGYERPL
jgi:predicted RNA-binding Zn-ribbon protein involved in translation (DUF1610 family)